MSNSWSKFNGSHRGGCPRGWTMSQLINKTRVLVGRYFGVFRGEMVFSPDDIWTIWRRGLIVWRRGTFSSVSNLAAKHVQLEDTFADMVDRWRIAQIILSDSTVFFLTWSEITHAHRAGVLKTCPSLSLHHHLLGELGGKDPTLHPPRTGEWTRCRNWRRREDRSVLPTSHCR